MFKFLPLILCLGLPLTAFAESVAIASSKVHVNRAEGQIDLTTQRSGFDKESTVATVGTIAEGSMRLFKDDFFDRMIVNGNASFKNTSDKKAHVVYYVSLFDKDKKLVASSKGSVTVEPGSSMQYGSALMDLPESVINTVSSYQIVVYESFEEIGTIGQ